MDLRSHIFSNKLILIIAFVALALVLGAKALPSSLRNQQIAQAGSAFPAVTISVRVTNEFDCEMGEPITHVFFDVNPREGAELTVIDHGMVRKFDVFASYEEAGLDGYFSNGSYEGLLTARPGYTLGTSPVVPFTVATECNKATPTPAPAPTPTPLPAPAPAPTPPASIAPSPTSLPSTSGEFPQKTTTLIEPTAPSASEQVQDTVIAEEGALKQCGSEDDCAQLCAKGVEATACVNFTSELVITLPPPPALLGGVVDNSAMETAVRTFLEERSGVRLFADADQDGIVDFDEVNVYGTDPQKADSDNDGVLDGAELLATTDPLLKIAASGTAVSFEDPNMYGVAASTTLAVSTVAPGATTTDAAGMEHLVSLTLSGRAPANSFVTLFIYSDPIVVVVKADDSGFWTYTLDKELPDGTHEVYSAITDVGGRVLAKSDPLPFVKEAAAVSLGTRVILPRAEEAPTFFGGRGALVVGGVLVFVLIASVLVLGFLRTKKEGGGETPMAA